MQTIRDKICADRPNDPICKLTNQTPAERIAKVRSKVKNMVKPVTSSIPTPPVTKPTPVAKPIADRIQEIRDKICNDSPELCEFVKQTPTPTSFANREEILKCTAEARKYCVEHPDTPVCKIILNQPASPASEQPNNEPGTPANTNPPANVPDSSASG